jgi:sugar phosphate isomerase/epimerase
LGISSAVFQKRVLGAREIAQIREAGITHLEISGIPRSFDYRNRRQVAEITRACDQQGLEIASFHTSLFPFGSECG